ncbi:hypothetical protein K1719_035974 [Acacia pycnantha]|nr:hypothetical protein K1719_035974 [Acacia pycnantha]
MVCTSSNNQTGLVLVLFLMLLMFSQFTAPCLAGKSRFHSFKASSASTPKLKSFHLPPTFKADTNNKGDGQVVFGADKRKVYTGPNPLHNR